jgi:hypothetical protein
VVVDDLDVVAVRVEHVRGVVPLWYCGRSPGSPLLRYPAALAFAWNRRTSSALPEKATWMFCVGCPPITRKEPSAAPREKVARSAVWRRIASPAAALIVE